MAEETNEPGGSDSGRPQGAVVAKPPLQGIPGLGRGDARRRGVAPLAVLGNYGTLIALVVLVIVFSIAAPSSFATVDNLRNVLTDMSLGAIIAGGLTFPLVAGDFDLSIGYVASLGGIVVVGLMERSGLSIPVAMLVVLAGGVVIGVVNGLVVTKLGVNAFIATLGMGTIVLGLNYAYSSGTPIQLTNGAAFVNLTLGRVAGIPLLVLYMLVVLGLLWVVLNRTVQGQHIKAVGANVEAARRAGVPIDRTRVAAFTIAGLCAALTGILLSSNLGSGQVTSGDVYLLSSFAAAFLGSAVLRDGQFHIVGTAIGGLTVAVGNNGLAIVSAPVFTQYLFTGGLLIVAVALSSFSRRASRS